jgi:hypothetical protein
MRILRSTEKVVQNGRDSERATRWVDEFLDCLVARIRALCTYKELAP